MIKLFNDDINDYIDENKTAIVESLNDYNIIATQENIMTEADALLYNDYEYIKECINEYDKKTDYDYILIVACFGLWYGSRKATKKEKTLLNAVASYNEDHNIFYFDKINTTLKRDSYHHDGVNRFKFYKVKNGKKYAIKYNDIFNN